MGGHDGGRPQRNLRGRGHREDRDGGFNNDRWKGPDDRNHDRSRRDDSRRYDDRRGRGDDRDAGRRGTKRPRENNFNKGRKPFVTSTPQEDDEVDPEPTLADYPCPIVGLDSTFVGPRGEKWEFFLENPKLRSWSSYIPNPFDSDTLRKWMEIAEEKAKWEQPMVRGTPLPRKAAWFVDTGCNCTYKYSNTAWEPTVFPDWFREIQNEVMGKLGIPLRNQPNSCNVNLYYNQRASVGWHSDNEAIFQSKFRDCTIISLSLGASRRFEVKRMGTEEPEKEIWLNNGDLMTMEGLFQKYYLHRVPKEGRGSHRDRGGHQYTGKRINFTWRWITSHARHDCGMARGWSPGQYFGKGSFHKGRKGGGQKMARYNRTTPHKHSGPTPHKHSGPPNGGRFNNDRSKRPVRSSFLRSTDDRGGDSRESTRNSRDHWKGRNNRSDKPQRTERPDGSPRKRSRPSLFVAEPKRDKDEASRDGPVSMADRWNPDNKK